ncbi:hypothetical protein C8N46_10424 [Kordia periserrulae]|uniref:Uncharacterized protein n=1 Tax=Kordia periserrulae TaxID=701523 RepID=A0A2T6BZ87_9FLAO|nr:hypothetical protein [Kordia periserrulae]PTX61381.1 hypothetical protein C8N46_10424 [Kordia periserrulae]
MKKVHHTHTFKKPIYSLLILTLTVGTMFSQSKTNKFQKYLNDINKWEVATQEQGSDLHVAFQYNKGTENKINSTHTIPLSAFNVENTSNGKTYELQRNAGTVTFLPKNKFAFAKNDDFKNQLEKVIATKAPDGLLLVLAMSDTSVADIKAVKAQTGELDLKDLLAVASTGVKADFINEIKSLGYEDISMSNIIAFKSMGIDAKWISEMNKEQNKTLRTSELIMLKKGKIKSKMKAKMKS